MIIRPGRKPDAPVLAALVGAAFHDYLIGIGRTPPGDQAWLTDALATGRVHVAEDDGRPLGLLSVTHDAGAARLSVDHLAVDPAAQGQGVGRALLDHGEALARAGACREIRLHTVARYDHLVQFYQRAGFVIVHRGPHSKGDDGFDRAFLCKTIRTGNPIL